MQSENASIIFDFFKINYVIAGNITHMMQRDNPRMISNG